ncbi:thioredoxin fold domain-containing protein [Marinifilum sp. D714]|uniref:thioredoxin family protein n=1 Tax=Marinifilum sp. D714 TaxID=2937523 RepID=UPI0027BE27E1|nr:thioredoxin fold domain-containing protein [Marinifilum sp. D714]MDQ2178453.1 thioredoxin domain-containing protein [Marinifilum sp. D714]
MKKVLVLLVATFICSGLFAQGIEFERGTFNEALAKAKKENKLIFMDCYTSWCGPCKYLAKNIFPQKEVGDYFNQNFVNVKMDMEKGEGIALCKKYGVSSFPTLLFIDANGKVVHKLVGGMPAEDLIKGAKAALNPEMRIGVLRTKYESGNRDLKFLMTYLNAVKAIYDRETMSIVAKEIIKKTSIEQYMNKEQFYVISASKFPYGSKEFSYLLANKDKVKEIAEPYEYATLFGSAYYAHLEQYAKECKNLKELNDEIDRCHKEFPNDNLEHTKNSLRYTYYIANNQLQTWYDLKIKEAEASKGNKGNVFSYHSICDEILRTEKLAAKKEIVDDFIKIAQTFAADRENGIIMGNLMLAKLYLHKKDKEKATDAFDIFIAENGKAGGNNTHPTVTRLKEAIDKL